tara:strand:+ start:27 stop:986 length:960 start_codon:yes stop_codon:yes gene_type:complete
MKKVVLINLIIIIFLICLSEITLRLLLSYNVQGISKNLINKKISYRFNQPNLNYGKAFGVKIYTDKHGFRIKENYNIKKNKKEILFVGGSVTFGPGIKVDKTFVELLNKESNYNLKNASVFGTNLENNIEIIKNYKNLKNVNKIFINFPLDDIISNKIGLEKETTKEKGIINSLKQNKIINYINSFIRSKSATYVFIKGIIANPQKNNYIHDLNLYQNKRLLKQLEINLDELSKIYSKEKIFFYSIPYAAQVKDNCQTKDGTDEILKKIFIKKNYSILILKSKFCENKKPVNYYLKKDPVHLSKTGHNIVFKILKEYIN